MGEWVRRLDAVSQPRGGLSSTEVSLARLATRLVGALAAVTRTRPRAAANAPAE